MPKMKLANVTLATEAPRDLHSLEYARFICEETLGVPPAKSNLEVISQAIEALSKAKFRDRPHPVFTAFLWLERQTKFAVMEGRKANHLFFLNGEYNDVAEPKKELPEFIPCDKCSFGWINVAPEGKDKKLVRCECFNVWKRQAA